QAEGLISQVTDSVKKVGLEYNLNKAIPANSFKAHRLSHFAKVQGFQEKMEERMFKAYFIEGRNIDDIPTLVELAKEIGLDASEVKSTLESTKFTDEVNHDLDEAKRSGITSVPKYIINTHGVVSGAQDWEVYLEVLEKEFAIWQTFSLKSSLEITDGQSCEIGEICN